MEPPSKHIIFISQPFGNPQFPKFATLPDIKHVELIFNLFFNLVGPKQFVSPIVFKDFVGRGILVFLDNQNFENLKT